MATSIGTKPYLSQEEEKELVDFLVRCSWMGYCQTRTETLKIVGATKEEGKKMDDHLCMSKTVLRV